jgi:hypothetical protein
MKKNVQFKKSFKALLLLVLCSSIAFVACKKKDTPAVDIPVTKNAKFSADVNGTNATGTDFLDFSYITTNDEFLEVPYTEIHIAGSNSTLDVMIANPTVKQYNLGNTSPDAGLTLSLNGSIYEATASSVLNITEATASKISGTISGTFKNVNTGANAQITNGSFSAQF